MASRPEPRFFASQEAFRTWLEKRHSTATELWVGLVRNGSGLRGIGYREALDEALCFGWIDGVRRSLDAGRWTIRFTPRKPGSVWSEVNIRRARELAAEGRMRPAGLAAFAERDEAKARSYSYERAASELGPALEQEFRRHAAAWAFFQAQPPYYRRVVTFYVASAKKEETRRRRLASVIAHSARGERLPAMQKAKREPAR